MVRPMTKMMTLLRRARLSSASSTACERKGEEDARSDERERALPDLLRLGPQVGQGREKLREEKASASRHDKLDEQARERRTTAMKLQGGRRRVRMRERGRSGGGRDARRADAEGDEQTCGNGSQLEHG